MRAFDRLRAEMSKPLDAMRASRAGTQGWGAILLVGIGLALLALILAPESVVDEENARYLLSGIGQAMAAIMGLSLTVILICSQLASQYSPRISSCVVDSEARFLAALFAVATLLPFVSLMNPVAWTVFVALGVGWLCLVSVVKYFVELPARLSPQHLVESVARAAAKRALRLSSDQEWVFDLESVLHSAVNRMDRGTLVAALRHLRRLAVRELSTSGQDRTDSCGPAVRCAKDLLWAVRLDPGLTGEVLHALEGVCDDLAEGEATHGIDIMVDTFGGEAGVLVINRAEVAASNCMAVVTHAGAVAAGRGWTQTAEKAAWFCGEVSTEMATAGFKLGMIPCSAGLAEMGARAVEQRDLRLAGSVLFQLEQVLKAAGVRRMRAEFQRSGEILFRMGCHCTYLRLEELADQDAWILAQVQHDTGIRLSIVNRALKHPDSAVRQYATMEPFEPGVVHHFASRVQRHRQFIEEILGQNHKEPRG